MLFETSLPTTLSRDPAACCPSCHTAPPPCCSRLSRLLLWEELRHKPLPHQRLPSQTRDLHASAMGRATIEALQPRLNDARS
jgi:hypothetical protein